MTQVNASLLRRLLGDNQGGAALSAQSAGTGGVNDYTNLPNKKTRGRQGQGSALDPPGAKPLDLNYLKINNLYRLKVQGLGPWWGLGQSPMLA